MAASNNPQLDDTPSGHVATTQPVGAPIRLGPRGHIIIQRTTCWRPACRAEFAGYTTIIFTITNSIVAHCHRRVHDDLGYRADVWKYGEASA